MGMAASQARLLMLTARIHDVEYEAQSIQHAKLQLATQQDEIYQKYMAALDAQSMTFTTMDASGTKSTVIANFNNLFSINAAYAATGNHYLLTDANGQVVVDNAIYEGYHEFLNYNYGGWVNNLMDNAYQFAMFMVEGGMSGHEAYASQSPNSPTDLMTAIDEVYAEVGDMATLEADAIEALNNLGAVTTYCAGSAANILNWAQSHYNKPTGNDEDRQALDEFVNYFWSHYGQKVFNKLGDGAENVSHQPYKSSEFNYYVRIYNAIQERGCISIDHFNGPLSSGGTMYNAANNAEWLTAMIQSGQLTLNTIKMDNQGHVIINGTSLGSDSDISLESTTKYDKTAMAKAEAEYEHELKQLDQKDKKFDMALNKLESERTALTKQYDSMKKVVSDNIERTFGIFS